MPITVSNKSYKDMFNASLDFYRANAGDKQTFTCDIIETISVFDSPVNYLKFMNES